jgi:hypothetical protein
MVVLDLNPQIGSKSLALIVDARSPSLRALNGPAEYRLDVVVIVICPHAESYKQLVCSILQ